MWKEIRGQVRAKAPRVSNLPPNLRPHPRFLHIPILMVASITLKPPAFLLIIFVTLTLIIWNRDRVPISYLKMPSPLSAGAEWSSKYQGWYSRSTPHDSPSTFTPTREALAFVVLHNAQADPDGFTLALFHPNVAVDAMGRVLVVQEDDFAGLTSLAQKTLSLPQTGSFWNTWRIARERSEQVIRRLFVAESKDGELGQTSVQGYSKERTTLKPAVGSVDKLPEVLWELFGLIPEALEGYERDAGDTKLIDLVKETLGEV